MANLRAGRRPKRAMKVKREIIKLHNATCFHIIIVAPVQTERRIEIETE